MNTKRKKWHIWWNRTILIWKYAIFKFKLFFFRGLLFTSMILFVSGAHVEMSSSWTSALRQAFSFTRRLSFMFTFFGSVSTTLWRLQFHILPVKCVCVCVCFQMVYWCCSIFQRLLWNIFCCCSILKVDEDTKTTQEQCTAKRTIGTNNR